MIIEQSVPIPVIVEIGSILLILFSMRHISIARHYESETDKKVIGWFMIGLALLAFGSAANLIKLFNLHSYFLSNISFQVFSVLAPLAFLIGDIMLRKS